MAPEVDAPRICIIDSGIQEGHRLLAPAIDSAKSISFVNGDPDVNDKVSGGGHGTKVAGAVLYGNDIPRNGNHQLPFWIQNAKILDSDNRLVTGTDPTKLMVDIASNYPETRIFNLSVSDEFAFIGTHMPPWAAVLDKISYEHQKLFIVATGNIPKSSGIADKPGLKEILSERLSYPEFLHSIENNKVCNPGISSFSLTVGSVCIDDFEDDDRKSFGAHSEPSSFTRSGLGIWNMVKPDVVEFGGDFVYEKLGANRLVSNEPSVSPELVYSTRDGHSAIGKNTVGTSFAAPKVAHIAGWLNKSFPALSSISYKALIVQSARLPADKWRNPVIEDIKCLGYGIPSLERATKNSETRITFLTEGNISPKSADTFMVKVPNAVRRPGLDSEILIEITLTFNAPVRRTRKYTKSYLGTWLTWEISTPDESYKTFCDRVLKSIDMPQVNGGGRGNMQWMIYDRGNNGIVRDMKRQDSTTQKDWTLIKSNALPEEFAIAVVGHQGWDKNMLSQTPYSIVVSFEAVNADIPIYELFEIENRIEVEQEVEV